MCSRNAFLFHYQWRGYEQKTYCEAQYVGNAAKLRRGGGATTATVLVYIYIHHY